MAGTGFLYAWPVIFLEKETLLPNNRILKDLIPPEIVPSWYPLSVEFVSNVHLSHRAGTINQTTKMLEIPKAIDAKNSQT